MINLLWMLYIALMLFSTVITGICLVDGKHKDDNDEGVITFIILFTCVMWAGFIVYYLN
jgi:hypothetical protein